MSSDSHAMRQAFAANLAGTWHLRDPAWRHALQIVPREVFLGERVYRSVGAGQWEVVTRKATSPDQWLAMAYSDQTWVTQLNNGAPDVADRQGRIIGVPTSSTTLPGVVVAMLEDLKVEAGHAVLEIGTGTGYSGALMSQRLGDNYVTSVEIDPGVSRRAARALKQAGYRPRLLTGDGLIGAPHRRFDRIIATCSVLAVPPAWLEQTCTGGIILAALTGWQYGFALARLTVTAPGTATGEFLDRTFSFMLARPQENPREPVYLPDIAEAPARRARYEPDAFTADDQGWMLRWLAQLAFPFSAYYGATEDGGISYFHDTASNSWACLRAGAGSDYTVHQTGPLAMWDVIEQTIDTWRDAGSPPQSEFALTISDGQQTVTHPKIAASWTLPVQR